jgi:hypothetical protein
MGPQRLAPNLIDAERFLTLFGEGDAHCFQYFDDTKKGGDAGHFHGHLSDVASTLAAKNNLHRGIYFVVNATDGGGRSATNITSIRAVFADLDGAPLQPVLDCPLEPHIIVQSSPTNYHAYWLVDDCPLESFSQVQKAIARRFNSDTGVSDLPRVMRVPGFWNCKEKYFEPFQVKILKLENALPYKLESITAGLGLTKLISQEAEDRRGEVALPDIDNLTPGCIAEGNRHETLLRYAYKFACENRTPTEIKMMVGYINQTYCATPKPLEEIDAIVKSAAVKVPHVDLVEFNTKHSTPTPKPAPKEDRAPVTTFAIPEDLLHSAPGITGLLANWLTETNFYWQPSYSLAGALAFMGMVKGHNVCTEENARTNLLTIAVGPSSSGKTQPLKRLVALARESGLSKRLSGEPVSEQGLVRSLVDCGHKTLIPWDEIGLAFKGMFSTYAPNYKAGIVRLILKIYSMADETVLGFQYANGDGKSPRLDLHQPCLCLYGTTTAEGMFGAFSSVEAVNGFAARLLIFETHNYLAERQPTGPTAPPSWLVDAIKTISNEDNASAVGNMAGVLTVPCPRVVPYTSEGRKIIAEAGRTFEGLKNAAIRGKRPAEESIWGRAYEQATKVALTVEDGSTIGAESAKFAVALITALSERMIIAAKEQIADNQVHSEVNAVLKLVKEGPSEWVDSSYLCRKTRHLPAKRRKEILASLVEEGTLEIKEEATGGRVKALFRYV